MDLKEAMQARHSVRQYKDQPLSVEVIAALQEEIAACNRESGLHIQLVTNEPRAFDGFMAHYGKFSGVTSYLALIGKKRPELDEKCGYFGQRLVLKAQQLGLNTCWVAMSYTKIKTAFTVDKGEKLRRDRPGLRRDPGRSPQVQALLRGGKGRRPDARLVQKRRGGRPAGAYGHEPAEIPVHPQRGQGVCQGRQGLLYQAGPGHREIPLRAGCRQRPLRLGIVR